jgi:(S)-citramalyl-CoA lyase
MTSAASGLGRHSCEAERLPAHRPPSRAPIGAERQVDSRQVNESLSMEVGRIDTSAAGALLFGPFRLIPAQRLLLDGDKPVRLGSRALDILIALVERRGALVSKRELMGVVWPDTVVVETNLTVHVAALRRALGDGQAGNRYIVNVPGRGYRFVAPVAGADVLSLSSPRLGTKVPSPNLPGTLPRLIGRTELVDNLARQLPMQRSLSIVGRGRIGNAAVALDALDELVPAYEPGVWLIEPAPMLGVSTTLAPASSLESIDYESTSRRTASDGDGSCPDADGSGGQDGRAVRSGAPKHAREWRRRPDKEMPPKTDFTLAPTRSWLITPAAFPDCFAVASAVAADVAILDLEHAVGPDDKDRARATALDYLRSGKRDGARNALRINGLDTRAGIADLNALLDSGAACDYLVLPRTESAGHLQILDRLLTACGRDARLVGVVESARGLDALTFIAAATPRLACLMLGAADMAADLGATTAWEPLAFVRARLIAACALAGVAAIDAPYFDVRDAEGLAQETARAVALGFRAKAAIHPEQVGAINTALTPQPRTVQPS